MRPVVLQSMGLQRVGHDLVTEQQEVEEPEEEEEVLASKPKL